MLVDIYFLHILMERHQDFRFGIFASTESKWWCHCLSTILNSAPKFFWRRTFVNSPDIWGKISESIWREKDPDSKYAIFMSGREVHEFSVLKHQKSIWRWVSKKGKLIRKKNSPRFSGDFGTFGCIIRWSAHLFVNYNAWVNTPVMCLTKNRWITIVSKR